MADPNPYADILARDQASPAPASAPNPYADILEADKRGETYQTPPETGALEAAGVHAVAGVVPALGTLAGAELGAEAGVGVGAVAGPLGATVGGIIGAVGGGFYGGWKAGQAQDSAMEALPGSWKDAAKQELATTEKEHPWASLTGVLAPYAVTMSPVGAGGKIAEGATALSRVLNHPVIGRFVGGALQGGLELSNELWNDETPDWAKVSIASVFGVIWNKPNAIGERIAKIARGPTIEASHPAWERAPTIANVDAANVAGPGVTEAVADGSLKRNEAAEQAAQDAQRTEASIIGLKPEPDLHGAVERMAPEAVAWRDELEQQAKVLREAEVPNPDHIAETQKDLRGAREDVGAAYARAAESHGVEPVMPPVEVAAHVTSEEDRAAIAGDVKRQLIATGEPEDRAEDSSRLVAERYASRAETLQGRAGTAADLYRAEGARIATLASPEEAVGGAESQPLVTMEASRGKSDRLGVTNLILALDKSGASPREIEGVINGKMSRGEIAGVLGRASEAALAQKPKGKITQGRFSLKPGDTQGLIELARTHDASSFMEEAGHDFVHQMSRDVLHEAAPDQLKADWATTLNWLGVNREQLFELRRDGNYSRQARAAHEKFSAGWQQYLWEGRAPSARLIPVFERFKAWLKGVYDTLRKIPNLKEGLSPDMREVFDRMLAAPEPKPALITPDRPVQEALSEVHAMKAEAATAGPQADAVGDQIAAEAIQREQEHEPARKIIESTAAEAAERTGEAPERAHEAGLLAEGGGRSEPDSEQRGGGERPGEELGRGGAGVPEGAPAATGGAERPVARQPARGGATAAGAAPFPEPRDAFERWDPRDVDRAGNVNLDRINTTEDIKRVYRATAETIDFNGDRLGRVTWQQTRDIAETAGLDWTRALKRHLERTLNASEAEAMRVITLASAHDVHAKMVAAADGDDKVVLAYVEAREKHKLIQTELAHITAEAGRTLNIFRRTIGGEDIAGAVDKIIREGAGITLDQARKEAILGAKLDTPEKVGAFMNSTRKPGYGSMLEEFWINGLISGPATHITYSIANQLLAIERNVVETGLASVIGKARAAAGRTGTRVRPEEVGANIQMMFGPAARTGMQGAVASFKAGVQGRLPGEKIGKDLSYGTSPSRFADAPYLDPDHFGAVRGIPQGMVTGATFMDAAGSPGAPRWGVGYSNQGSWPNYRAAGIPIPVGSVFRAPSRFIAAMHTFFRFSIYPTVLNAQALRTALEERDANPGMTRVQVAARVEYLTSHPTPEMMQVARDEANIGAMMGPAGAMTKALQRLVNTSIETPLGPVRPLKYIDPFVQISSAIMREGLLKRTPVGLLSEGIRDDLMGKNGNIAADMAAARMIAGTMLAVTTSSLAAWGYSNGSGPVNAKLFNVWREAGNLPHSIRIGDMWYSVNRLGPLGLLMSVAADMHDVAATASEGDFLQAGNLLQHAFTHNILDESFLRGPADALKAIFNPATDGERWIKNMGTSFLPFSVGMAQLARGADPYSREARTFMDSVKLKTPGFSESLWPRISIWGQPMPSYDALVHGGVTAIYEARQNRDPVNLALLRLGLGVAPVRPTIRGVQLTDQQFNDYATLVGRMRKQRLDALVGSQIFQRSPGHLQHDLMKTAIDQSKTAAEGWMFARYPSILRDAHTQKMDILMHEDEE